MASPHRESKIMAAVACPEPDCRARIGQPCHLPQRGRLVLHPARKAAWQALDHTPYFVLSTGGPAPTAGESYTLVAPQTAEARDWLALMTAYPMIGGAAKVPQSDMPALIKRIIAAGWKTGDVI